MKMTAGGGTLDARRLRSRVRSDHANAWLWKLCWLHVGKYFDGTFGVERWTAGGEIALIARIPWVMRRGRLCRGHQR